MDAVSVLRMFGTLALVLGAMTAALWFVRRFNIRLPGAALPGAGATRLELVERIALDPRRSVALVRRDGREHLLLLAPEGHQLIEAGFQLDEADRRVQDQRSAAEQERRRAAEQAMADARANAIAAARGLHDRVRGLGRASVFARMVDTPRPTPTKRKRKPSRRQRSR